ncbi:hypothetical protein Pcinc_025328 [Petrolisthes cinctipes]|uniref:Hemimethylated DNA-binding domain-containing protein n=1 Tax=Petrolisthes cinctipes TaxID=88211 RepID=A0AAE1F9D0_PETCI|nr:hypothetical protein Pcinc_025328 [Petrolisthes cinctipes]
MEEPVTIQSLPYEVVERILSQRCVGVEDVVSCCITSKYMNGVCRRNSLWKTKFIQDYPYTFEYCESMFKEKKAWRANYISLYKCKRKLVQSVLALSRTFVWSMYHDYEWPDIPRRALALYQNLLDVEFADIGGDGRYFILDECRNIINASPQNMELTLKYYAEKLHRHMYDDLVIVDKWMVYLTQPIEDYKYSYEDGIFWVALALRPLPKKWEASTVKFILCQYVNETLIYIKENYPNNPVCFKKIQSNPPWHFVSEWNGEHCREILQAAHDILRHKLGFVVNNSLCESESDHYCIDHVLRHKKGSSKLLLLIELCIGNRLGVYAEVHQNVTDHVLATWKVYYHGQDGSQGYLDSCQQCNKDLSAVSTIVENWEDGETETVDAMEMCRAILRQVVFLTECWLKGERWHAGEPVLYDLYNRETYKQPIRLLFSAWQHVEHWKMSQLYHYMNQLSRISENPRRQGKLLHLNILLRVNSKLTLRKLISFRRTHGQPPKTLNDLMRMLISVDKRARTRVTELKGLLSSSQTNYASLNPLANVPWPHGWPGGEMVQKRRVDRKSLQVQFAVGEVLEQRGGDLCVVYDWDSICVESDDTLVLMGETGLSYGTDQPFYRVLTDGGSCRYLAQENLRHARHPCHIRNPLIGRYFTAFIHPFYLPNPQKAYEYPEDANIREQNALNLKLKFATSE